MNRPHSRVGGLTPKRSVFDLSYTKVFDCDMGQLIPICHDEMVPGDHFTVSNEMVIRLQPMLAPILHHIDITTHYFFVPYRLLWDEWESFITGGVDGDFVTPIPLLSDEPFEEFLTEIGGTPGQFPDSNADPNLVDYLSLPQDVPLNEGNAPLAFPFQAYNFIYNEYYRDQNLQDPRDLHDLSIAHRAWTKDYFTSQLPFLQRGTAPGLPVGTIQEGTLTGEFPVRGTLTATGGDFNLIPGAVVSNVTAPNKFVFVSGQTWTGDSGSGSGDVSGSASAYINSVGNNVDGRPILYQPQYYRSTMDITSTSTGYALANGTPVTFQTDGAAFTMSDMRLAFQIQKWQERNARSGARYTEFLRAHFGVSPNDDRLQRPEYIGGTKSPIIISEVLQTSSTDTDTTPQGNLAGHGISVDKTFVGKYFAKEYGVVIGLMSIMPRPSYGSQGVNRQWLRRTKFDFYFREFANLSEQATFNAELVATGDETHDQGVFGFQARYDEMRIKQNLIARNMRGYFSYWHLARFFETDPDDAPRLNEEFIRCDPDKRIFAVETEPGFIVHYANRIKAVRPLPLIGEPGFIDHF